jgi:SH3-like domain-containing protein
MSLRRSFACALLVVLTLLPACKRGGGRVLEVAYVSGVQVNLRDRVAPAYDKVGIVKNGDRVDVLDHDRRFVKVRTSTGQMGWMEQRYLVSQQVYDQLQKLTADNANDPVQAMGVTRNDTNLHVEPGRETEHLYQISAGEKLSLLKRGTADKNAPPPRATPSPQKPATSEKTKTAEKPAAKTGAPPPVAPPAPAPAAPPRPAGPPPVIEDWWLVRDSHGRVGWVLARMVDLDIPLDVAQYAEGQRIVAFFTLNEVPDGEKQVPQYLMVLTEPRDGMPFDFNQFRVFTWNVKRHRYETAYRERAEGMLPVTVSKEDFGKEGVLPVFVVRLLQQDGKLTEQKYKLNTPIVRRVLAPGEEPSHAPLRKTGAKKKARRGR